MSKGSFSSESSATLEFLTVRTFGREAIGKSSGRPSCSGSERIVALSMPATDDPVDISNLLRRDLGGDRSKTGETALPCERRPPDRATLLKSMIEFLCEENCRVEGARDVLRLSGRDCSLCSFLNSSPMSELRLSVSALCSKRSMLLV